MDLGTASKSVQLCSQTTWLAMLLLLLLLLLVSRLLLLLQL
jgi:hypothetical protein